MEHQKLTTILFDLDGTLLPMNNDAFTKGYFKLLAARLAPLGYEPGETEEETAKREIRKTRPITLCCWLRLRIKMVIHCFLVTHY